MKIDKYGQQIYTEDEICDFYLKNSEKTIKSFFTEDAISFSDDLELSHIPSIIKYISNNIEVKNFDENLQSKWFMPTEYKTLDIALYVLNKCKSEGELQRAGEELFLYQERGLFPLLQYLKYLVDVMRANNIVWGVGRGSCVASYVLFLIGVHRINSLYYDLSIDEFLK